MKDYFCLPEGVRSATFDWPSENDANRKITIFDDGVLTYDADNETFTLHRGVLFTGIVIPENCLVRGEGERLVKFIF